MRIAVAGKGGAGKTAVSAMLVRALAEQDRLVLAVDFDVNGGLLMSLGDVDGDGRLPHDAVVPAERADGGQYGYTLRPDLSPAEAVERYAARGTAGVRLLSFGVIDRADHDLGVTHLAARKVAAGFAEPGWDVVADMEAGTKDVFDGGYVAFADLLVLVTDGAPVANLTCRRLATIARHGDGPPPVLVGNRVTPERAAVAEELARELDVPFAGAVPHDDGVRLADMAGRAVFDAAPGCPAAEAVRRLVQTLRLETEGVPS